MGVESGLAITSFSIVSIEVIFKDVKTVRISNKARVGKKRRSRTEPWGFKTKRTGRRGEPVKVTNETCNRKWEEGWTPTGPV